MKEILQGVLGSIGLFILFIGLIKSTFYEDSNAEFHRINALNGIWSALLLIASFL